MFHIKIISVSDRQENIVRKRENAGLPAFSPFSTMFSNAFLCRAMKTRDYLGNGYDPFEFRSDHLKVWKVL